MRCPAAPDTLLAQEGTAPRAEVTSNALSQAVPSPAAADPLLARASTAGGQKSPIMSCPTEPNPLLARASTARGQKPPVMPCLAAPDPQYAQASTAPGAEVTSNALPGSSRSSACTRGHCPGGRSHQ
ncbi:hypothetical protein NDU88_001260 [Pleurodeles waltl]|uniref:Uncharacterized protein n=1 Tax=Pleurodeles waltl TaxID=8319 RepID=A0AAV7WL93_PLEWA|nr:hypothetical protein NDU88_001260 [Pleurodeles waltl]